MVPLGCLDECSLVFSIHPYVFETRETTFDVFQQHLSITDIGGRNHDFYHQTLGIDSERVLKKPS
jgi:hypothetical protein